MPAAADCGLLERVGPVFGTDPRRRRTDALPTAMSPTAKMSGSLVRNDESTSTPPSGPMDRPAASASSVFGAAPTATRTASAATVEPSPRRRPGRRAVRGGDLLDRCPESQVDTVVTVQLGEHLGDLATERAEQRQLGGLDDGHVGPALAGVGGHLQTDPAAADDRQRVDRFVTAALRASESSRVRR